METLRAPGRFGPARCAQVCGGVHQGSIGIVGRPVGQMHGYACSLPVEHQAVRVLTQPPRRRDAQATRRCPCGLHADPGAASRAVPAPLGVAPPAPSVPVPTAALACLESRRRARIAVIGGARRRDRRRDRRRSGPRAAPVWAQRGVGAVGRGKCRSRARVEARSARTLPKRRLCGARRAKAKRWLARRRTSAYQAAAERRKCAQWLQDRTPQQGLLKQIVRREKFHARAPHAAAVNRLVTA